MVFSDFVQIESSSPTGLVWKSRPRESFMSERSYRHFMNTRCGQPAGYKAKDQNGYLSWRIEINAKTFLVSRVIWEVVNGPVPRGMIVDHRNLNSLDNSLDNLRIASRSQNKMNGKVYRSNRTRLKGVGKPKRGKKWIARIGPAGKIFLGYFDTPEEAHEAYVKAANELFGEFARAS
jgi:hypothetical protein